MRYYDEMSQADVADVLERSQPWVSVVEAKALEKLRKWLL
jgi:DNA-directed RNA polymerase specialized sigma subunit